MTPQEQAAAIVADPAWSFADNPVKAVAAASVKAATAERDLRRSSAKHWTHVACLLVDAADSPHVARGAVLSGLVDRYGEP